MKIWSVHTGTHCACLQQCIFHYPWKARPPQSEPPSRSCTSFKHLVVNRAVFFFHSAGFCTDTEYAQHIKAQFCSRHATKTNALARREASSRKTTKKKKLRKKPKNFNHWIVFKDQPSNDKTNTNSPSDFTKLTPTYSITVYHQKKQQIGILAFPMLSNFDWQRGTTRHSTQCDAAAHICNDNLRGDERV